MAYLEDITSAIATQITGGLSAIPYQQIATATTDATCLEPWRELPFLLDPAFFKPEGLCHLGFSVLAASAPNSGLDRDSYDGSATIAAQIEVRYCYRIRGASEGTSDQLADYRLAIRAGREIAALLNREEWQGANDCRVTIANRWRPVTYENFYQIASVDFTIYLDEPLTFTQRV